MKIAITSKKGGVTKSTQTKEIALRFNLKVVDLDIDSHLKDNFPSLNKFSRFQSEYPTSNAMLSCL